MGILKNGKVNGLGKCSRIARQLEVNDHEFKVRLVIVVLYFPLTTFSWQSADLTEVRNWISPLDKYLLNYQINEYMHRSKEDSFKNVGEL